MGGHAGFLLVFSLSGQASLQCSLVANVIIMRSSSAQAGISFPALTHTRRGSWHLLPAARPTTQPEFLDSPHVSPSTTAMCRSHPSSGSLGEVSAALSPLLSVCSLRTLPVTSVAALTCCTVTDLSTWSSTIPRTSWGAGGRSHCLWTASACQRARGSYSVEWGNVFQTSSDSPAWTDG